MSKGTENDDSERTNLALNKRQKRAVKDIEELKLEEEMTELEEHRNHHLRRGEMTT